MRVYGERNRERLAARNREYHAANREKRNAQMVRYWQNTRRVCACGRPVERTGKQAAFWCSDSCKRACQWSVCESLAAGLRAKRGKGNG
jgi:hypothetical protein